MLYIQKNGEKFSLGTDAAHAALSFGPAKIEIDDQEIVLDAVYEADMIRSSGLGLRVTDRLTDLGNGLIQINRTIENTANVPLTFKDIFEVQTAFAPTRYLIPCVNYNGNEGCKEHVPQGLLRDGKPWIFAYDRTGIPSCTLSENKEFGAAIFASDCDPNSLRTACSMIPLKDGRLSHRIYHPVIEAPYTYSGKNVLTKRYDEALTLLPGETFAARMYAFACAPMYENYACANLLDCAASLFDLEKSPCLTPEKVWELGVAYAKQLLYDYKGHTMIITHFAPRLFRSQHGAAISPEEMTRRMSDPYYTEIGRFDERFEMGWADQGLLNARMLAVDAWQKKDSAMLETAIDIFDAWAQKQQDNGLLYSQFQQYYESETYDFATPDVCNFGWGAAEMVRMYNFLKSIGIDKPQFLRFAVKLCDFFSKHFSEEYGFGKAWNLSGECVAKNGSIGGFMLTGMLETYRATQNKTYLEIAKRASDFYYARDLDRFICSAGALDCQSIDKETAYPFITSSLMLYEETKDKLYLTRAKKAAYYFFSWAFHYDALYDADSEFTLYNYHTTGGTAISTEHHAIDAWGAAAVTEFFLLAKYTGDARWAKRARAMWFNAVQGITSEPGQQTHGQIRPLGAQNEGFFQCRWTKYRPTCEERGHFNDCLCAWSGAYRMMAFDNQNRILGTPGYALLKNTK